MGKADPDPSEDNADHTHDASAAVTDPICQSPLESDSEGDREVFMVGEGEQPPEKMVPGIAQEAEEKIARATRLARTGKKHNSL
jgi:hypothetical protein